MLFSNTQLLLTPAYNPNCNPNPNSNANLINSGNIEYSKVLP